MFFKTLSATVVFAFLSACGAPQSDRIMGIPVSNGPVLESLPPLELPPERPSDIPLLRVK